MTKQRGNTETLGLIALSGLFGLRVAGQALVSRGRAPFLPPMEQWQSGVLPYSALLASQGTILAVQAVIDIQSLRGHGVFITAWPRLGRIIHKISLVYFASMLVRYVVSMRRHPDRRWFGKTIPIIFHGLLATYLFLYARLLTGADAKST